MTSSSAQRMTGVILAVLLGIFLPVGQASTAAKPVSNGRFESGGLAPWTEGGINGGRGGIVRQGTCWSVGTTTGITLSGDYAADVRSGFAGQTFSVGTLLSPPFIAGHSVRFKALSERSDAQPASDPVELIVRILDGVDGSIVRSTHEITDENIIQLDDSVDCSTGTGESRDMAFSTHTIDTTAVAGQSIRLQFQQHTNVHGYGFFTLIDDVEVFGHVDATASISPTVFYPVVDGYRDELVVEGERTDAVSVDVEIRAASGGPPVREAAIGMGTGSYRWTWDGHGSNGASGPAALLPAGEYDVTVVLTDAHADTKVVEKRVTLSHDFLEWKTKTVERRGIDIKRLGLSRNATLSARASSYRGGLRLISNKGFVGVVYSFPVRIEPGQILGVVRFKVVGRSANRHKAVIAVWNRRLGSFKRLENYDAAKTIGPHFKTWKTTASPGSDHVRNGRARAAVMTWKGLGRRGRSVFDIKKVILTYRVATITSPTGTASTRRKLADIVERRQSRTPRAVADIRGRQLPRAEKRTEESISVPEEPTVAGEPDARPVEPTSADAVDETSVGGGDPVADGDAASAMPPDETIDDHRHEALDEADGAD